MYTFHFVYFIHFIKPLLSLKKKGVEYIFSRDENQKKSYSAEYKLRVVGGGDLRIFSVEDVFVT